MDDILIKDCTLKLANCVDSALYSQYGNISIKNSTITAGSRVSSAIETYRGDVSIADSTITAESVNYKAIETNDLTIENSRNNRFGRNDALMANAI